MNIAAIFLQWQDYVRETCVQYFITVFKLLSQDTLSLLLIS